LTWRATLEPEGYPCAFESCRPGPFLFCDSGELGLMSDYGGQAYLDNGDAAGSQNRGKLVQPVRLQWWRVDDGTWTPTDDAPPFWRADAP
jgi:hypothetical protein